MLTLGLQKYVNKKKKIYKKQLKKYFEKKFFNLDCYKILSLNPQKAVFQF